ncbi:MAG: NAD-glutamate dehydrogenase [Gemmatimonadetes bacterium]|nr:NAD-glutamate dehydrogenase [Gemmatimonadota bacterium]MYG21203.1 NAD-glutamate dehydrogenase [Gemmatimonadota bacterium]MYJ40514.1 NAD-glutamate dehydrogenase [Gemmatimonadota bacterium]
MAVTSLGDFEQSSSPPAPGADSPEKLQAIQNILAVLKAEADGDRQPLLEKFVPFFIGKAPVDLLEERGAESLARMCVHSFNFLDRSRPDRVDVQVLNPRTDDPGWYAPVTIVRTNVSERPFIVDTIREYLHSHDRRIAHIVYPLITVERDGDGRITDLHPPGERGRTESMVYAEISRVEDPEMLESLRDETKRRLEDVVKATDDFGLMVDKIGDVVSELNFRMRDFRERRAEFREIQAFLRWLRDGGFVFLGYRCYDFTSAEPGGELSVMVEPGSGLGVLQDEGASTFARPVPVSQLPPGMAERALSGPLLIISKTNAESTVHRRARMDYIGVKKMRPDGSIAGEHRFLGLFTSQAYAEQAQDIPILRQKLEAILESSGLAEGSHDYKEVITIFGSLPKEELFLASAEEILKDIRTILIRYNTAEVFVSVRRDALGRGVSIMVVLPRSRFSGSFRREFEAWLVRRYDAEILNYHLAMSAGDQARLHFYLGGTPENLAQVDAEELRATVADLTRSWFDEVRDLLSEDRPADEARRLARHYSRSFAPEYKAANEPGVAIRDIQELEAMRAEGRTEAVRFFDYDSAGAKCELKVYIKHHQIILSDFMPILENCGLRVIAVSPFELREEGKEGSSIYSFDVQTSDGERVDVEGRGEALSETILAVRAGDATNDRFNRLVQRTGMAWREIEVLRAYASYAFQIGAIPSRQVLPTALDSYPGIGRLLFRLFEARFDPDSPDSPNEREARVAEIRSQLTQDLVDVGSLAHDRALRAYQTVILSTVRTNYYRHGGSNPNRRSGGVPYVSFKFDCEQLQAVSKSRLRYEVWVRSSRMEGIHLRGASVARGGIRHSDRPDDFRTEVLGLVYTQIVKNAVIVPSGSKGGFVCLRSLPERDAMAHEAREQYRTLMRGLLDITDNLDGNDHPPERVVRLDGFDPYLVVAADKGTAPFSDTANAIAADYGFWLDDAFASGGSNGYDHKEVGITAGGAWESVKRHFREMGRDIQSDPFTVAGIGDMSGDVFGNGMLLSPCIRLVAAFDHRNVFVDPDPDPESSWEERKRLFELPRSSWNDYDTSLLSRGGMIVPRGAKSVDLSPEAREALGLPADVESLDGESLIRAVLRAPVDLLWNGGIGTYVKADQESHADAGDTSNDPVRVDAGDIRARVVGEGGNLGFTQAARVEYALGGGRINTDALDNSGGVNLSDREVNLKILLNEVLNTGVVTRDERNDLVEHLTDSVAALVLEDNESGCKAVSFDEYRARRNVDHFWAFMTHLSRSGLLDRDAEGLPSWDQLSSRQEANQSLTRPELAVLLSYAKLHLKAALISSDLPDDPSTSDYFFDYFPFGALRVVGRERAVNHRLRREIVACQMTNDLVDLMGSTFIYRLSRETGREPWEIARAWLVAAKLTQHQLLLNEIRSREGMIATAVTYRWTMALARVLERTTRWVLANCDPEESTTALIEGSLEGLGTVRQKFHELVAGEDREDFLRRVRDGMPSVDDEAFVRNLVALRFLDHLLEILRLARTTDTDPIKAARVYYWVTEELRIPWLIRSIENTSGEGRWQQRWALGLVQDLGAIRRNLTEHALDGDGMLADVLGYSDDNARMTRFHEILDEVEAEDRISLAGLSVAIQEIRHLAVKR